MRTKVLDAPTATIETKIPRGIEVVSSLFVIGRQDRNCRYFHQAGQGRSAPFVESRIVIGRVVSSATGVVIMNICRMEIDGRIRAELSDKVAMD
jgi:hypothetical protein